MKVLFIKNWSITSILYDGILLSPDKETLILLLSLHSQPYGFSRYVPGGCYRYDEFYGRVPFLTPNPTHSRNQERCLLVQISEFWQGALLLTGNQRMWCPADMSQDDVTDITSFTAGCLSWRLTLHTRGIRTRCLLVQIPRFDKEHFCWQETNVCDVTFVDIPHIQGILRSTFVDITHTYTGFCEALLLNHIHSFMRFWEALLLTETTLGRGDVEKMVQRERKCPHKFCLEKTGL